MYLEIKLLLIYEFKIKNTRHSGVLLLNSKYKLLFDLHSFELDYVIQFLFCSLNYHFSSDGIPAFGKSRVAIQMLLGRSICLGWFEYLFLSFVLLPRFFGSPWLEVLLGNLSQLPSCQANLS